MAVCRCSALLTSATLGLAVHVTSGIAPAQDAEPRRLPPIRELPPAFSEALNTVENDALDRLRQKDLRRISLREISLFHRTLIRTLDGKLPDGVNIRNQGPLVLEAIRQPRHLNGEVIGGGIRLESDDLSGALCWSVEGDLGIFGFWISTARTNSTVAVCDVERRKLFVNVDWVSEFRSVDDQLPELGGCTVREVLKRVERACAEQSQRGKIGADDLPAKGGRESEGTSQTRNAPTGVSDFDELIELIQRENRNPEQQTPRDVTPRDPR